MQAAMLLLVLALFPLVVQAQQESPTKATLFGMAQVQFSSSSVTDEDLTRPGRTAVPVASTMFETRRVRFGADVTVAGWIIGKIESELAPGRVKIADVWGEMAFSPALAVRIGQFKKPFSVTELTSDSRQVVIERGVRIRGLSEAVQAAEARGAPAILSLLNGEALLGEMYTLLSASGYAGRDFGAVVRGKMGVVDYEAGVFNGAGQDRPDDNDAKSIAGRVRVRPGKSPLFIAAGASSRDVFVPASGSVAARTDRGTAWEIDFEFGDFRRPGWNAQLEFATGDNIVLNDRFVGAQGVITRFVAVGSRRLEGWEAGARASYGDPGADREADEGWLFSPLVNFYFAGRNRMMFGWDVYVPAAEALSAENSLRAQLQVYF